MDLTENEIDILSNEHPALLKLYLFLKKNKQKDNSISCGFHYNDIQEFMSVPSKKGKKPFIFSKYQIRYLLNRLIEIGLISQLKDLDSLSFELSSEKLYTDLSTDNQEDNKSYPQRFQPTFTPRFAPTYPQEKHSNHMNNMDISKNEQSRCTPRFAPTFLTIEELTKYPVFSGNKIKFNHYHFVVSECIYILNIHTKILSTKNTKINNINNNITFLFSFGSFLFSFKNCENFKKNGIEKINENVKKVSSRNIAESFADFWVLYPKKVGKAKCLRKFISLCKSKEGLEKLIIDGIRKYLSVYEMCEKKYIPHPHTWLNQERWEDDIESLSEKIF